MTQSWLIFFFAILPFFGLWLLLETYQIWREGVFYRWPIRLRRAERPTLFAVLIGSLTLGGVTLILWGCSMMWLIGAWGG